MRLRRGHWRYDLLKLAAVPMACRDFNVFEGWKPLCEGVSQGLW